MASTAPQIRYTGGKEVPLSLDEKSEIERRILAADLDQILKVRLFQILEQGPTSTETYLIRSILACDERHKKGQIPVDAAVRDEFNQP